MVSPAINDKFDSWLLKELNFPRQRTRKIMTPLSYHLSNLLLIALETMQLLAQMLRFCDRNKTLCY